MKRILLFSVIALWFGGLNAQNEKRINYEIQPVEQSTILLSGQPQLEAANASYFWLNVDELEAQLIGIADREGQNEGFTAQFLLPHPDGSMHAYRAMENNTMHPDLRAKFQGIHSYDAYGIDEPAFVKWDITPKGLHAMIMIPGQSTIFIDPVIKNNRNYYIVYFKNDFQTDKIFDCSFEGAVNGQRVAQNPSSPMFTFGTCDLRTYRLALAATGEYTAFHGGTVALAQAAQVTTMNRVNGVYERDMAITMVIVPNNNLIVYTNSATDPYANGNTTTMITQNQTNCDNVIGSANYDIGHVFGTNSGGLAGLGVVCSGGNKARGVTGSGAPIGDPFDIDYVAHEMGHQFGANHTQNNNCNRNNATAMEPGSASTIMGYAGICTPNVQNNSDDHFHGISLEEISNEILSGPHNCEQLTTITNSAPTIVSTNGNVTVPAGTPFALTAVVTDPDGDPVTYNWEQMDNQVSTQPPVSTSTGGPNFRSWPSSTSPTRYFPSLTALANNGPFTWEVVPTVTRTMNFRVTVRDNSPGPGGCNDHADVTVTTDAGSGPFIVLYPSATGIVWNGNGTETVTWDVANTDVAPVACDLVDILLSTDGGQTYTTVLASGVPNDGSQVVNVPNVATTTARIMVICSNGTFFDISNNNFEITMATFDYTLNVTPPSLAVCQPNDGVFTIDIGSIGGYSDIVDLSVSGVPAGAGAVFGSTSVTPVGTTTLTINNTGAATPGSYTLTVQANSTSGIKTADVVISISTGTPGTPTLTAPADAATGVSLPTTFTWSTVAGPGITYDIEISSNAAFTNIVDQATGLSSATYVSSVLAPSSTYYWRVRAVTGCGNGSWSSAFSFTTGSCILINSTDVPVSIPTSIATVTSTLVVPNSGIINDINVLDLTGTHTWINDLVITLTSPQGTSVVLFDQVCNNQDNFDLNFDDAAASATLPCPPTGGGTYQPNGTLSSFNGEDAQGTWILTVDDVANQDGGALTSWALEICFAVPACVEADVPVLTNSTVTCEGETSTISIAGNLNDATEWYIYEGSCGGTLVGTTATSTFDVTPSAPGTTYYVRGEDGAGCIDESVVTCEQITINVTAAPTISLTPSNPTSCGGSEGSITVNGSGTGTVTWTGPVPGTASGQTLPYTITGLTAGAYTVTFNNGCPSNSTSVGLSDPGAPTEPTVVAVDGCGSSTLSASGMNLVWSTGETTASITVTTAGSYTVTQTVGGCTSLPATVIANPIAIPSAPTVTSVDGCGSSTLTATGSNLLWSTGESTASIVVTAVGSYTVTQTVGGCESTPASVTANPTAIPSVPTVTVVDDCGSSVLTATGSNLLWSTGETTASITVATGGSYTVTQTVNGCESTPGSGTASPFTIPTVTLGNFQDVCLGAAAFTLTGGSPAGGSYSGPGVSSGAFDPSAAGVGTHSIVYSYTDGNGCSATTQNTITVNDCAGVEEMYDHVSVYPNPVKGTLFIRSESQLIRGVKLIDAAGRIVWQQDNVTQECILNMEDCASAMYHIEVILEDGVQLRYKLIKE